MKHLILTTVFLAFTSISFAQTIEKHSYKKAKIYLDNHRILKVNNLEINSVDATFLNSVNKKQEKIVMNTIKLIRIPEGSYMWQGALYGAGTMALTALLIDIQPDDSLGLGIEQKRGAGFYLGLTAGGAALGALVGSLFPKWKSVYSGGKFVGQNLPVNLGLSTQNDQVNIKIIISI
jgi:hypothetical protein